MSILQIPTDLSQPYSRYGITIGRLRLDEIETLRRWRTHPEIARFMIFQEPISAEAQLAWFTSVDNRNNLYGTIYWKDEFVGLSSLRDIDHETGSAEGGMIIWGEHQNSLVPFRAALTGTDLAFWGYQFRKITARIRADNKRALRFNKALGYRFEAPDANGIVTCSLLNRDYWPATLKLREVIDREDGTVNGGTPFLPVYDLF